MTFLPALTTGLPYERAVSSLIASLTIAREKDGFCPPFIVIDTASWCKLGFRLALPTAKLLELFDSLSSKVRPSAGNLWFYFSVFSRF